MGEGTALTLLPSGMPCWLAALPTLPPVGPGPGELGQVTGRLWDLAQVPASLTLAAFLTLKALLPNFPLGLRPILKCSSVNGGAPRGDVLGSQATWEMID